MTDDVKTEVLFMKKDLDNLSVLFEKLEVAIDKLTDVSNSINKMLAVHENRLGQQEELTRSIFTLIEERRKETAEKQADIETKMKDTRKEIQKDVEEAIKPLVDRIDALSKTVHALEKWKFLIVGGGIVIGMMMSHSTFFQNILGLA